MFKILAILALSGLATAAVAQEAPVVSGTVKKIDTAQSKLTIDHGPIANLDMSAMTMVFKAADPAMLSGLKAGEKIRFTAGRINGQITVTSLKKAP